MIESAAFGEEARDQIPDQQADAQKWQKIVDWRLEQFCVEHAGNKHHDAHARGQPKRPQDRAPVALPDIVPPEPDPNPPQGESRFEIDQRADDLRTRSSSGHGHGTDGPSAPVFDDCHGRQV